MTKLIRSAALVLACATASVLAQEAKLQDGDRVAICGDSITEQKNYSVLMECYLLACQPAQNLQAAQFGWGGETAWDFAPRMKQDVLWLKPTAATICYGMNDGGYREVDAKRLSDYRKSTRNIIRQFKAAGTRLIVVGGPGAVDIDSFRTFIAQGREAAVMYNKTLDTFGEAAREVAKEEGVVFADLHRIMADAMVKFKAKYPDKSFVGNDGIHPDNVGHTVMAYAFLKALGCDGNIGTITVDLAKNQANATDGHKVLNLADNVITLESTRYPFQAPRNMDPLNVGAAMDVVPFHEELNRFKLVVGGIPSGKKVTVTWSEVPAAPSQGGNTKPVSVSREFDASDLATGINLPAVFPTTPFEHAWGQLDSAVHAQQDFETPLNKQWLHRQAEWSRQVPSAAEKFKQVGEAGKVLDEQLRAVSAAMVVPVKHTIKIEVK